MPTSINLWQDTEYLKSFIVNPKTVVEKLDKYIIGQKEAKEVLAIALLQRSLRFLNHRNIIQLDTPLQKNNILMLGQTGSGKTALMKALSEVQEIPILIYDITSTTSAGYVGMKVENIIGHYLVDCIDKVRDMYRNHGDKIDETAVFEKGLTYAECGIVYIDEFDKCRRIKEPGTGRDINGEGVQQGLLKIFEGNTISLKEEKGLASQLIKSFNCEDLLIVAGGAFQGLAEIIVRRLQHKGLIGFSADVDVKSEEAQQEIFKSVINQDLIEYGFLPELIGRINYIVPLNKVTEEMLLNILLHAQNSPLRQYQSMFKFFGIDLQFTKPALKEVVKIALNSKTGARALNTIISKILLPIQYDILDIEPGELLITKDHITKVY